MVRLTLDLIARGTSGYTVKRRDENIQCYVKRLTHLYLENRNIDEIVRQGGHGTGKTGNLVLTFSRQGKHREFCCDTGKVFET